MYVAFRLINTKLNGLITFI